MRQETAYRLLSAARLMLNSLETERSDIAWQNTAPEVKAAQYDRAVNELCCMIEEASAEDREKNHA